MSALPNPAKRLGDAEFGRYAGAGLTFAATIGAFAVGGYFLDRWLGTSPWLLIAGVFLGGLGGFLHLVLVVAPIGKRPRRDGADKATAKND